MKNTEISTSVVSVDAPEKPLKPYWLYLLECKGGSYYAGIALDVEARFKKHQTGKGAAYTRARPPLQVLKAMEFPTKGEALKAEYVVKQLPRKDKPAFFDRPRG